MQLSIKWDAHSVRTILAARKRRPGSGMHAASVPLELRERGVREAGCAVMTNSGPVNPALGLG